jgi:hypothetical protein
MSLVKKNFVVAVLAAAGLLSACQPTVVTAPEQVETAAYKPPPQIELLPIPPEGLSEEQLEERREAERWNAIYVCFRCHDMSDRSISQQPRRRQKKHRKAMKKRRSCLDCHNSTDVRCCHDRIFPEVERWK